MRITESQLRKVIREEAKRLVEMGRYGGGRHGLSYGYGSYGGRSRGGSGSSGGGGGKSSMIDHIMISRGVGYDEAEQILTDIYDDVGHDPSLVSDAVYGGSDDGWG